MRPVLTLLTAQLGEGNTANVITAAKAIEITHLASLYHDDVMDDAPVRRGVPSAQAKWGNSVAILTGDLLFARASKLVASLGSHAIDVQADTFERLCLGQLHETIGPQNDENADRALPAGARRQDRLADRGRRRTSGCSTRTRRANTSSRSTTFGEKIGVAFQLIDDVIDLAPKDDNTGKDAGTDLRAGVATLPLLFLRRAGEDRMPRPPSCSTGSATPCSTATMRPLMPSSPSFASIR